MEHKIILDSKAFTSIYPRYVVVYKKVRGNHTRYSQSGKLKEDVRAFKAQITLGAVALRENDPLLQSLAEIANKGTISVKYFDPKTMLDRTVTASVSEPEFEYSSAGGDIWRVSGITLTEV